MSERREDAGQREQAHTPGPWVVDPGDGLMVTASCNVREGHAVIAKCSPIAIGHEAARANARLIAAVPELLEAAEKLAEAARNLVSASEYYLDGSRKAVGLHLERQATLRALALWEGRE